MCANTNEVRTASLRRYFLRLRVSSRSLRRTRNDLRANLPGYDRIVKLMQRVAIGNLPIGPVALSNQPVFDLQSADTHELAHVRRHQNCSEGRGVGSDE